MGQRRLFALFLLPPLLLSASPSTPPSFVTPEPPTLATGGGGAASSGPTASTPPDPNQASPGLGEQTPSSADSTSGPSIPGSTVAVPSTGAGPSSPPGPRSPSEPALSEATPRPGPWPEPVRDVAKLCVCDLLVDQCDVNCCCDPTCTAADFSLFTTCSVPVVTGDSQLCRQKEALYSIDPAAHPPERRFQLADKVNPSVFCIQTANYKPALSFQSPEIPTSRNFDRIVQEFGGAAFGTETDLTLTVKSETQHALDENEVSRYKYRDPIKTTDGFLQLPAPLIGSLCADKNPSGFLVNQAVKCSRVITPEECASVEALSVQFYTAPSILVAPKSRQMVNVTVQSITVEAPGGLRTRLRSPGAPPPATLQNQSCSNAVLEASYHITFREAGKITSAAVALVLGTINTRVFVQQSFSIHFVAEQATGPVRFSGNPGYVVGLPIRAGFWSPGSGVVQSVNENGQLTMMKSSSAQDCLAMDGVRTPVLFGYNMMSGCQLRVTKDANCKLLAPALLNALKGQNFPDCVASFGNSLPQNGLSWVQIYYNVTEPSICRIPVSFQMEVKWTKYGSLVNPQAQIVSLTATVLTAALPQMSPHRPSQATKPNQPLRPSCPLTFSFHLFKSQHPPRSLNTQVPVECKTGRPAARFLEVVLRWRRFQT